LGEYIFRGVASVDSIVILAGAVPAALLALLADVTLGALERWLTPGRKRNATGSVALLLGASGVALLLLVGGLLWSDRSGDRIVIGSKDFTEQVILGELLAQTIERTTALKPLPNKARAR
jgi:osmoprotectant transport system permease protein